MRNKVIASLTAGVVLAGVLLARTRSAAEPLSRGLRGRGRGRRRPPTRGCIPCTRLRELLSRIAAKRTR